MNLPLGEDWKNVTILKDLDGVLKFSKHAYGKVIEDISPCVCGCGNEVKIKGNIIDKFIENETFYIPLIPGHMENLVKQGVIKFNE